MIHPRWATESLGCIDPVRTGVQFDRRAPDLEDVLPSRGFSVSINKPVATDAAPIGNNAKGGQTKKPTKMNVARPNTTNETANAMPRTPFVQWAPVALMPTRPTSRPPVG